MPASEPPAGASPVSARVAFERARPLAGGRLLLATDFDGTLAGVVLDPWLAAIIPAARRALRRLAGDPRTHLAFISGRTVADLAARVRVGGATYLGDHGAQWAKAPRGFLPGALRVEHEPVSAAAVAVAQRLRREVPRHVAEPWLVVEDKGTAVTFHFRSAPDTESARARVRAAVEVIDSEGLLDQPGGRRAWELRPPGATTKGVALARLIDEHEPDAVIMIGDDRHDAEAFDVVRATREEGRAAGLAIAVASPAGDPAEMARRADVLLAEAAETARFLTLLARSRTDG